MAPTKDFPATVPSTAAEFVRELGDVFAVFDESTQDSVHVSYGVAVGARRWFVKTAGTAAVSPAGTTHDQRVMLLRRAALLQQQVRHPALVTLHRVVDTTDGVAVVYDWFDGEPLRSPANRRSDADEAGSRFIALPAPTVIVAVDTIIDLHVAIERGGWVAGDVYDGCLMYDFTRSEIRWIDLERYHWGPYRNTVGRLPGSTRFMAPEESRRGAVIDTRTTVFNLGRMIEILLPRRGWPALDPLIAAAVADDPSLRPQTVRELHDRWSQITAGFREERPPYS